MIRTVVASDGVSELAKQKWKSSCCSPHACWSQQQMSKLANERLILNSPWVDFNTNQFSNSLKGVEADQLDILHSIGLQRKRDFADWQKTKETACTVLHEWIWYQSGSSWMCSSWGKGHPHQERPLSLLAAGPQHHLPFWLPLGSLWPLQPHLRTRESNFSNNNFQVMQHWVTASGSGLTWIQRIDKFSNHWMRMIPHCHRNHVQWNMFPYTWAMVPQQKQSNLSWATAISFSTLNCNESLSSISNENHSIHTKYGFWLPRVFCLWTRRQWCLNKCDIQAMDFLCLLKTSTVINSFWFFCHPMETIKCVAILTSMQTTFFEQFR